MVDTALVAAVRRIAIEKGAGDVAGQNAFILGYIEGIARDCASELRSCLIAIRNDTAYNCVRRVAEHLEGKL